MSVYVISRVHCAQGCVYILLTLFLYLALRAHVRCKCLENIFQILLFSCKVPCMGTADTAQSDIHVFSAKDPKLCDKNEILDLFLL